MALLCGREWRALLSAAVTVLLFLALSTAVLGFGTLHAFFSGLGRFSEWASSNNGLLLSAPTFFSFFHLLGIPTEVALLLHGVPAALAAFATGCIWYRGSDVALRSAALIVATLLFNPYLLDYDLACLAAAIAWFAQYGLRRGWREGEREMMVLAWLLPLCMIPLRNMLEMQLGPFVLLALFLMILRRALEECGPGTPGGYPDLSGSGAATDRKV